MSSARNKLIKTLSRVGDSVKINEVIFTELTPKPARGPNVVIPYSRISIPLSGRKWMNFATDGEIHQGPVLPGQAVFSAPYCWTSIRWHLDYEMVGLVFLDDYLRVLYANQKDQKPRLAPDIYFHTEHPMNQAAWHLVHTLEEMASSKYLQSEAPSIVQSLVNLAVIELRNADEKASISKATQTWRTLAAYVHENYRENITRTELADMFELHPAYISRLFKKISGTSFQDYVEQLRMELATRLLLDSNLSVNEISKHCGYASTSYFIHIFRKHFHKTPGEFKSHINVSASRH